jgi:hypothetical protein
LSLRTGRLVCCRQVRYQNSATRFSQPASFVVRCAENNILGSSVSAILEFGSGCLRNSLFLQKRGYQHLTVVELIETIDRFTNEYERFRKAGGIVLHAIPSDRRFDCVIAAFVLETICPVARREETLRRLVQALRPQGILVLAIRGPKDIKAADLAACRYEKRAFVTTQKTFIRKYSVPEIMSLVRRHGFRQVTSLNKVDDPKIIKIVARKN